LPGITIALAAGRGSWRAPCPPSTGTTVARAVSRLKPSRGKRQTTSLQRRTGPGGGKRPGKGIFCAKRQGQRRRGWTRRVVGAENGVAAQCGPCPFPRRAAVRQASRPRQTGASSGRRARDACLGSGGRPGITVRRCRSRNARTGSRRRRLCRRGIGPRRTGTAGRIAAAFQGQGCQGWRASAG